MLRRLHAMVKCDTRLWSLWRFHEIVKYVQLGTPNKTLDALNGAAIARQATKDSGVRSKKDLQKGRYGYLEKKNGEEQSEEDEENEQ